MAEPTFRFESLTDATFDGSMLVAAFPAPGFVSQVAARYLVASQSLPLVGAFRAEALPPAVAIQRGRPLPPLRVHVGAKVCGLDRSCEQLAVLVCDIAPPEPLQHVFARDILEWAAQNRIDTVVVLEGLTHADPGATRPRIAGASSSPGCLDLLKTRGIEPLDSALVTGMTGALLDEATRRDQPCVVVLFTEAHNQFRDATAAAALVETIDKFLLHIPIDAEPLRRMAEEITEEVRSTHRGQGGALPSMYA